MTTWQTREAIRRLMKYGAKALEAKYEYDPVRLADLRTSAADCRIAIRATREEN